MHSYEPTNVKDTADLVPVVQGKAYAMISIEEDRRTADSG